LLLFVCLLRINWSHVKYMHVRRLKISSLNMHVLSADLWICDTSNLSVCISTCPYIYPSVCGSRVLVDLGRFLSFLIMYTVGRTPWTVGGGGNSVARPLSIHRTTHTQNNASNEIRTHDPSVRAGEDC
jgi:hypothetical protein